MQLINTARWLRLRRDTLTKHPICQDCEAAGYVTPATEVHHVKPVEDAVNYREKVRLMYDPHNLRALCHACHVQTHIELGRGGKAGAKRRAAKQLAGVIKKFFQ